MLLVRLPVHVGHDLQQRRARFGRNTRDRKDKLCPVGLHPVCIMDHIPRDTFQRSALQCCCPTEVMRRAFEQLVREAVYFKPVRGFLFGMKRRCEARRPPGDGDVHRRVQHDFDQGHYRYICLLPPTVPRRQPFGPARQSIRSSRKED